MSSTIERDLIDYVTEQKTTAESKRNIRDFCESQPKITKTVYRAHTKSKTIRPSLWFSSTASKDIAVDEFMGRGCCLFTIHVVNVPAIDVNSLIGEKIGKYAEEHEFIILGDGTFYKDKALRHSGFLETSSGEFECYYSLDVDADVTDATDAVERAIEIIPIDEYEFIETVDDINVPGLNLTEGEKGRLLEIILSTKKGGSKCRSKQAKSRKRKQKLKHVRRRTRKHNYT